MEYFSLSGKQVPFLFAAKESSNLGLGENGEEYGPQDWETSGNQREKAIFIHKCCVTLPKAGGIYCSA